MQQWPFVLQSKYWLQVSWPHELPRRLVWNKNMRTLVLTKLKIWLYKHVPCYRRWDKHKHVASGKKKSAILGNNSQGKQNVGYLKVNCIFSGDAWLWRNEVRSLLEKLEGNSAISDSFRTNKRAWPYFQLGEITLLVCDYPFWPLFFEPCFLNLLSFQILWFWRD